LRLTVLLGASPAQDLVLSFSFEFLVRYTRYASRDTKSVRESCRYGVAYLLIAVDIQVLAAQWPFLSLMFLSYQGAYISKIKRLVAPNVNNYNSVRLFVN